MLFLLPLCFYVCLLTVCWQWKHINHKGWLFFSKWLGVITSFPSTEKQTVTVSASLGDDCDIRSQIFDFLLAAHVCNITYSVVLFASPGHGSSFNIECHTCSCFAGDTICSTRECLSYDSSNEERRHFTGASVCTYIVRTTCTPEFQ